MKLLSSQNSKQLNLQEMADDFMKQSSLAYHHDLTGCKREVDVKRMIPPRTALLIRMGWKTLPARDRGVGSFILGAQCYLCHLHVGILVLALWSLWCAGSVRTKLVF